MPEEYEYSVPMSFGTVGSGSFNIQSPWNTPCEMCLYAINPGGGDGGAFLITFDGPSLTGITEKIAPNDGGARGIFIQYLAASTIMPAIFFPMPQRQAWGYWSTSTQTDAGVITVIFRRALGRYLEMPPLVEVNPHDEHQYHEMMARQRAEEGNEAASLARGGTHAGRGE